MTKKRRKQLLVTLGNDRILELEVGISREYSVENWLRVGLWTTFVRHIVQCGVDVKLQAM